MKWVKIGDWPEELSIMHIDTSKNGEDYFDDLEDAKSAVLEEIDYTIKLLNHRRQIISGMTED